MAMNQIYVETEEEIPELVERLRRYHGEDTMLVLPMRSRIGQSRFNFQLLRNYSARLGKRVTVVCDDPAVQAEGRGDPGAAGEAADQGPVPLALEVDVAGFQSDRLDQRAAGAFDGPGRLHQRHLRSEARAVRLRITWNPGQARPEADEHEPARVRADIR